VKARLIVYKDSRRIEKGYTDHTAAVSVARTLRKKGLRAAIVTSRVIDRFLYPPEDDDLSARDEGMLWCPYCRDWRWFKVPRFTRDADLRSAEWFLNSYHRQDIRCCAWCHITELDFYVRKANDTWGEQRRRRRRKRRRRS
jgi:hypothetical protein